MDDKIKNKVEEFFNSQQDLPQEFNEIVNNHFSELIDNEEYIPVVATQDGDGHWYVIPKTLIERFHELLSKMEEEDSHDRDITEDEFFDTFDKYMTGGDLNLIQLYIKQDK